MLKVDAQMLEQIVGLWKREVEVLELAPSLVRFGWCMGAAGVWSGLNAVQNELLVVGSMMFAQVFMIIMKSVKALHAEGIVIASVALHLGEVQAALDATDRHSVVAGGEVDQPLRDDDAFELVEGLAEQSFLELD